MNIPELIKLFMQEEKEGWYTGMHAANNALFLKEYQIKGKPTSYIDLAFDRNKKSYRGPLFIIAKEYLTEYFKNRGGYYGAKNPHTITEIYQQTVDGLYAIARIEMLEGCDREFWVKNRNNLMNAISIIQNSRYIFLGIEEVLGDRKFCATEKESCASQIIKALEQSQIPEQLNVTNKQTLPFFDYLLKCTRCDSVQETDPYTSKIGTTWKSVDGVNTVVAITSVRGSKRFLIQVNDNAIRRLIPVEEIDEWIKNEKSHLIWDLKKKDAERLEEGKSRKNKLERENLFGYGDDFTPIKKGKAVAALSVLRNYDGEILSRKQKIIKCVKEGWKVVYYNTLGNILESPDRSYLDEKTLTKTGIEFAKHLISLASGEF
jgi:hypothetical protein